MAKKLPRGTKAETIREYLRKNPEGTRPSFIHATGLDVLSSQFSVIRKEIDEERKANKHQKSWKELAANVDPRKPAPPKPLIAVTGEDVNGSTSDMYVDLHEANNLVLQLRDTEKKMDEYRYRCWKLEGEKFGYVQRLLEEKK